jgi:lipoyl(octanoyl) transferase
MVLLNNRSCLLYQPGTVPYKTAWTWQRSLLASRIQHPDQADALILLEHPPVYTLGQGASLEFLKIAPDQLGAEIYRIERGGEVTYHCPGQLVGYPILNLRYYQPDLHWYLRQLEEVLIQAIAPLGLKGDRIPGMTGVWVDGYKVGAIGIKVSRWITMHGFSLNVCPDLQGFQAIVPCGIADRPVGSLAQLLPHTADITVAALSQQVSAAFAAVFEVDLQAGDYAVLSEALPIAR